MNTQERVSRPNIWELRTEASNAYTIIESSDLFSTKNSQLVTAAKLAPGERRLIVVDSRVDQLYGDEIRRFFAQHRIITRTVVMAAGEVNKTMDSVLRIIDAAEELGIRRYSDPIIAVGGGVVTDTTGAAAHIYQRGTPHIRIPTTLVGLVDAGIGLKVGINYGDRKNLIGGYQAALASLLDYKFLKTLPLRHIRNGLFEILKIAIVCDRELFELLEVNMTELVAQRLATPAGTEVIRRAVTGMLLQLRDNPFERELRRRVDFGHTFSPRIEMDSHGKLLHGEAVGIDMALCCGISVKRGLLDENSASRMATLLMSASLSLSNDLCDVRRLASALEETARHRDGSQHVFLPTSIGHGVFVEDIRYDDLIDAARWVEQLRQREQI